MPKFRKKPVVIEAEQYTGREPFPRGVLFSCHPKDGVPFISSESPGFMRHLPFVVTIHEQRVYLQEGDWVVPEPDGIHFYPVKPDIFEQTYEPVHDPACGVADGDCPDCAKERR